MKEGMHTTDGRAKAIFGAIALVVGVVILIAIASLIVGSILASPVFDVGVNQTPIINTSLLTDGFAAFVIGIIAFLGIIGIIIGIVWLISYLKPLFSKDEGIQSFAGN